MRNRYAGPITCRVIEGRALACGGAGQPEGDVPASSEVLGRDLSNMEAQKSGRTVRAVKRRCVLRKVKGRA